MHVQAQNVEVTGFSDNLVDVELQGASDSDYLEQIDAKEAVSHYGENTLLDIIGRQEAMSYFGLVESEV